MEIIAKSNFVRPGPRKLRLVADQIRGLPADQALSILENQNKRGCGPLLSVLKQGIGNAVNNFKVSGESLKIKTLEINEGPRQKRFRFVSRGRVHQIKKRLSHIRMILEAVEDKKGKNGTKS